ncbi:caspase family protein [Sporosarcina sp. P21c]|uniref:caspase family protein n=1 Tax=Sporosarcina sp. P21c TaxID=2048255 RepID=UPI0013045A9A|nr:caspase family protein [Sporosarcina sp. P21c]
MDNNRGEYKAIIIAADRYKQANDLPNTLNDAREIKKLLTEEPSHFKEENVQYYHGNLVTKAVLVASLTSFFTKAKSEDILFLFWAGHGGQMNGEGTLSLMRQKTMYQH